MREPRSSRHRPWLDRPHLGLSADRQRSERAESVRDHSRAEPGLLPADRGERMTYRRRFDRTLTALRWPDTNPVRFVRDARFALRYWDRFHEDESLGSRWRFMWRQAWRVQPANR